MFGQIVQRVQLEQTTIGLTCGIFKQPRQTSVIVFDVRLKSNRQITVWRTDWVGPVNN
jgi:hypothetical protein